MWLDVSQGGRHFRSSQTPRFCCMNLGQVNRNPRQRRSVATKKALAKRGVEPTGHSCGVTTDLSTIHCSVPLCFLYAVLYPHCGICRYFIFEADIRISNFSNLSYWWWSNDVPAFLSMNSSFLYRHWNWAGDGREWSKRLEASDTFFFFSKNRDLQFPPFQRWNSLSLWPCQVEGYSASRIGVGHYKLLLNLPAFISISTLLMLKNLEFSRCEGAKIVQKCTNMRITSFVETGWCVAKGDLPVSLNAEATCTRNTAIPIVMWWSQNQNGTPCRRYTPWMVAAQVRDICMATPLPDAEVRSQDLLVEPALAASVNIFYNNVHNHLLYTHTLYYND